MEKIDSYKNITADSIKEFIKDLVVPPQRRIVLFTGVGGKDNFDISVEVHMGYIRIYLATKLPRIARRKGLVYRRDYRKRWYILKKKPQ